MNNFDKFQQMTIDEFADWLDKHGEFDGSPWMKWYSEKYCENCDSIDGMEYDGHCTEYAYCEVHHKCRFFEDMAKEPNNKDIINWIRLNKNIFISEVPIGWHKFDENSNDYETSKIRQYLLNWYEERKNLK